MKSKALCLVVGGLIVTAGAVGNTLFADTQARPDNALSKTIEEEIESVLSDLTAGSYLFQNGLEAEEEQRNDDWREHVTFNDEA